MNNLKVEFLKTSKKNDSVLWYSYQYYYKRENKTGHVWVCSNSKCNASVSTVDGLVAKVNGCKVSSVDDVDVYNSHKHDPVCEAEIEKLPIALWNQFENEGNRSNNNLEGFNFKLNCFMNIHPHIWKFIERLKQEQTHVTLKYLRINNNTLKARGRNSKDIERDLKIESLKCKYLQEKVDVIGLMESYANLVHDYST